MEKRKELLATSGDTQEVGFKVQINNYDFYQSTPTVFDRTSSPSSQSEAAGGNAYHHVPVVRVYGSLPTGHRILAHIHGVFPYLYIPYEEEDCLSLQMRLEAVVAESLRRKKHVEGECGDVDEEPRDRSDVSLKYIAHVSICKGTRFYGYHVGYTSFFKIYLLNPSYLNRVADLLRDGALGKKYEVFGAHIPYGLQFLSDFNLFGCGWLKLQELFIRLPVLADESLKTDELVEYMMGYHTVEVPRIGRSALEIDTCAQYILNRLDLKERHLHHDFVEKFTQIDPEFIYIQSTKDLWKDGEFQRKIVGEPAYLTPKPTMRSPDVKWVEDDQNKLLFDYIKGLNPGSEQLNFNNFVKQNPSLKSLPTSFEAVGELFYEPELDIMSQQQDVTNEAEYNEYDDVYYQQQDDQTNILHDMFEKDLEVDEPAEEEEEGPKHGPSLSMEDGKEEEEITFGEISDLQLTQFFSRRFKKRRLSESLRSQSLKHSLQSLPSVKFGNHRYIYSKPPPTDLDFKEIGLPEIQYQDPFYSDLPAKPFIKAGKKFNPESKLLSHLKQIPLGDGSLVIEQHGTVLSKDPSRIQSWKYTKMPPAAKDLTEVTSYNDHSQVRAKRGFKFGSQEDMERLPNGFNELSVLYVEVFVRTRDDLKPNPTEDPVVAIFWKLSNGEVIHEGVLTTDQRPIPETRVDSFTDEFEMIESFAQLVKKYDPDILSGYEVHNSSWGYLIDRSRSKFDYEFIRDLSRCSKKGLSKMGYHWGYTHTSSIQICGRHVINIWRSLKSLNLSKNSVEHVAFHLLHQRIPSYTHRLLTDMWQSNFIDIIKFFKQRVEIDFKLMKAADIISKATEEARMIGIDFTDVFYRGSQYKVESLMIRIAKAENFMMLSPSKKQVRNQKPLECIPLVMEPISAYYKSPLVVLDFQSLYPSIIIAYNYCYSTLLGRLKNYSKGTNPIGTGKVKHPPGLLKLLENDITLSPNGLMFVNASVRKSLIAKMLTDILDTRFMVKATMKHLDANMKQLYDNRQLALKLTANVTYGYTSASFSGRMPCSDIADAIVQTGRETLERAVEMIETEPSWGAKVVYGDTDSLFVYLPGRSMEDAFRIGNEMASAVTKSNPDPVTLKFEKVYHPCLLMAKKRYVGYSYETLGIPPKFDAKGIETVRRDGYPAQQYIVEQCLRTLFETQDITKIKEYVVDQFKKIINNDLCIQDFCFARAVKVGRYKNPPPGAIVSEKKMEEDERAKPEYKERVPYVIIEEPGSILRQRARSPEEFLKKGLKLDAEYYIVKTLIPPLERIFNLIGVDVKSWYTEMPKKAQSNIKFFSKRCVSCGRSSSSRLCAQCKEDELGTLLNSVQMLKKSQRMMQDLLVVCRSCSGEISVNCESHDCPNHFQRIKVESQLLESEDKNKELTKIIDW
ncbi:unnamed protein product [Cyberlindnera jadinii]|uniref:DNA polymerase n=1 Tax=Cyberlindnera jadinii (strain ATCC 18201 / CBS 1600 / BCRC 20928 / JCM 3617 / NBRC 0987 / NRRL Y-1542) TaxID=983966 RepID=A0A0H5C398_CYBJN|nr:unnamed protein product [Cyberlindnera jadinii]